MKISDILGNMLHTMTPENWGKGSYFLDDGSACLVGHMIATVGGCTNDLQRCQIKATRNHLRRFVPNRQQGVIGFNDDESTSYEDVILVVKKGYEDAVDQGI